jgi:hypothetical protein
MLGANCKRSSATAGAAIFATQKAGRPLYCMRLVWRRRFQYAIAKNGNAAYSVDREVRRQPPVRAIDDPLPWGRASWAFLSALAQDERERIVKRAQIGLPRRALSSRPQT